MLEGGLMVGGEGVDLLLGVAEVECRTLGMEGVG